MSPAKVLAVGGLISGVVGSVGGALGDARVVGAASFVMLLANVVTLIWPERRTK